MQDEAGTCKTIFSSNIDVVKSEVFVESEKAMENVEAMHVIANTNANDTVIFWPFDPAKNAIQGGAPEGSDTSLSLEIGRGCAGIEACLYYCVGVWR